MIAPDVPLADSDLLLRTKERDELVDLIRQQATDGDGMHAVVCLISGMPGIGKSEFAAAVARSLAEEYGDGQIVLDIQGFPLEPIFSVSLLQRVIHAFAPLLPLSDSLHELQACYQRLLMDKRVMILADDVGDSRQIELLRPPPGSLLIATSRDRFMVADIIEYRLELLVAAEAQAFIQTLCPSISADAALYLAQLGRFLPLTLSLIAHLLAAMPDLSIKQFIRIWIQDRDRLAPPEQRQHPMVALELALTLSYGELDVSAQEAFCQLGIFASSFDLDAANAIVILDHPLDAESDRLPVEDLLDLLQHRGLLRYRSATKRYSMHRVVRRFALELLANPDAVRLRYTRYYLNLLNQAGESASRGDEASLQERLDVFDRERMHLRAAWLWLQEHPISYTTDLLILSFIDATALLLGLRYTNRQQRLQQLGAALWAARRMNKRDVEIALLRQLEQIHTSLGEARRAILYNEERHTLMSKARGKEGKQLKLDRTYYAPVGQRLRDPRGTSKRGLHLLLSVLNFLAYIFSSFWAYPLLIIMAQMLISVSPLWSLTVYVVLLVLLLRFGASEYINPERRLTLALTLIPLTRVLSMTVPFEDIVRHFAPRVPFETFEPLILHLILSPLLLIAASFTRRHLDLSSREIGMKPGNPIVQLMLAGGGLGIGMLYFLLFSPPPLMTVVSSLNTLAFTTAVLLVSTGFIEGFLFRGVLQAVAVSMLGIWGGPFYVAVLFTTLHVGNAPLTELAFILASGLFFGYASLRSGSIVGTILAQGLANVMFLVILPILHHLPDAGDMLANASWIIWGWFALALTAFIAGFLHLVD